MPTQSSIHPGIDREALMRVLEPVVHAHGGEVVDVEFKPERGGWTLRVYVERAGASEQGLSTKEAGVSLELCANVSRDLSPALDVVDLIPHAYQLEVSSPGVERPLRTVRDFERFKGQKARLRRHRVEAAPEAALAAQVHAQVHAQQVQEPVERVVVGVLDGVVDGHVRLIDGKRTHEVPLSGIESARLVFEFGARGPHPKAKASQTKEPQQRKH